MNEELERIVTKIKKCLALSESSNPNEAAAALRQAQALMRKYGLDETSLQDAEIGRADVESKSSNCVRPPAWETALIQLVGNAFGCRPLFTKGQQTSGRRTAGGYCYVGVTANTELASHTATVLLRTLLSGRSAHVKQLKSEAKAEGWRLTSAEERSAENAFCVGWLSAVGQRIAAFANPPGIDDAIQRYVEEATHGRVAKARPCRIGRVDQSSVAEGVRSGSAVRLHRPMNASMTPGLPAPGECSSPRNDP